MGNEKALLRLLFVLYVSVHALMPSESMKPQKLTKIKEPMIATEATSFSSSVPVSTTSPNYLDGFHEPSLILNLAPLVIAEQNLNYLKDHCQQDKCKKQSELTVVLRESIKQLRLRMLSNIPPYNSLPSLARDSVERTMALVLAGKKAAMLSYGIPSGLIEPSDDGLFDGDILLSDEEAVQIIRKTLQDRPSLASNVQLTSALGRRKKRSAYFWPSPINPRSWNSPIHFFIDFQSGLGEKQARAIRRAFDDISSNACLRFVEKFTLASYEYSNTIVLAAMNQSMPVGRCVLSTRGQRSLNFVFLNLTCNHLHGEALHGILHVLGVAHHHNRFDRDEYLKVLWSNTMPQFSDVFFVNDPIIYSTYGTPFSLSSIMNLKPNVAALLDSDATMEIDPPGVSIVEIGQRQELASTDILLLKEMYCCRPDCKDIKSICGYYAYKGFCDYRTTWSWMNAYCKASCGHCCQ